MREKTEASMAGARRRQAAYYARNKERILSGQRASRIVQPQPIMLEKIAAVTEVCGLLARSNYTDKVKFDTLANAVMALDKSDNWWREVLGESSTKVLVWKFKDH